eukprot:GHVT01096296.1.p1 GENE.GHVT01096296.1~~GHVT01096296.1.p1  ORF type:complete len:423 (+),score=28.70 GHVT01096296.1:1010-2278(+)
MIFEDLFQYIGARDRAHLNKSQLNELKEKKKICVKNIADCLYVASGQGNIIHNKFNSLGKYPTTTDMFDMAKFVHHHLGIAPVTFADMTAMKVLPTAKNESSSIRLQNLLSNMESNYSNLMADIYAGKGLTNLTPYTNAAVSSTLQYELQTFVKKAPNLSKLIILAKEFAPEAPLHIPGSWLRGHPTPSELLPSLFPMIPSFQAFDDIDRIMTAAPPHTSHASLSIGAAMTKQLARRGILFHPRDMPENELTEASFWKSVNSGELLPRSSIADLAKAVRPIWEKIDHAYMAQTVLIPNISPAKAWQFARTAYSVDHKWRTITAVEALHATAAFPKMAWPYMENGKLRAIAGGRSVNLYSVNEAFLQYYLTHGPHGTIPSSKFQFETSSLETPRFVPVSQQNNIVINELMMRRAEDPFFTIQY